MNIGRTVMQDLHENGLTCGAGWAREALQQNRSGLLCRKWI